jgi:hypothetical protein
MKVCCARDKDKNSESIVNLNYRNQRLVRRRYRIIASNRDVRGIPQRRQAEHFIEHIMDDMYEDHDSCRTLEPIELGLPQFGPLPAGTPGLPFAGGGVSSPEPGVPLDPDVVAFWEGAVVSTGQG